MEIQTHLVNRVANSSLKTINLEDYFPKTSIVGIDLKNYLFKELILREKDFRDALSEKNWEEYRDQFVHIFCSTDAIIPMWAYMLISTYLQPYTDLLFWGNEEQALGKYYSLTIHRIDLTPYTDQRVVIKGCSKHPVPASAFMDLTTRLRPLAKSIMFGEPCSTVPIFKQKTRSS